MNAPPGTAGYYYSVVQCQGMTGVKQVAAGVDFSAVLNADNTVSTWGFNLYGQLGEGTNNTQRLPVQVQGLTNVKAISAGTYFALALKNDGTVLAWGNNSDGQLGDGTNNNSNVP